MKSNKYLLVVLSILILFVFIASASAADSNGTDVLSVDESTSTVNEELALDYSSDNAESNDTNVLENDENNLLSADNGGVGNVLKEGDVGKNNEIYGITYAEDEGDSMSPVLGDGYYDININFDSVYNPEFTFFMCDVMGPDMPSGTLDLSIDNSYVDSFRVDNGMCSSEIHSLDAGDYTWYAEFTPDGSSEKSTGERSFTIDPAYSYVYIDDPWNTPSIEMDVDESRNFRGHVDGPEPNEVNISSSNDNIAKFRSSSISVGQFYGYIDAVGAGTATITVSFAGNKNYRAAESKTLTVTVTAPPKTIYVNASANQGGNGSEAKPFKTLKDALDVAGDGDTIMIAAGEYTGTNNRGLSIRNNISLEKYGEGEAIFDAEKSWRILNVYAGTINITGLTFKNGRSPYGGAIYFDNPVSNSNINAVFINNTADQGGAILFGGAFSNSIINATFINNNASREGGANYFCSLSNVIIIGDFINNTLSKGSAGASAYGGANYFYGAVENSNISGTYNHNAADRGGANYFYGAVENSNIDGAYTNNAATVYGGASYFYNPVTNSNISGTYNHNTAETGSGGANSIRTVTNSNISGTYTNNVANDNGGANDISLIVTYSNITGTYINNTAGKKSIIYIDAYSTAPTNVIISNAVFLNNNYDKTYGVIYAGKTGVTANDNWFGNNATDYDVEPKTTNVRMDNWLFLNATADPSELDIGENSTIIFRLYDKNSPDVAYDASKMNIKLTLEQTLGELDKTSALLGEEITYTAKNEGDATVTATFETAFYTVNLKNIEPKIVADWTYIGFDGKEYGLDKAKVYLPWNFVPECFVRDANGTALPVGTNITVSFVGEQNYTINTQTQEDGLFTADLSNFELGTYETTFSTDGYTTATATVYIVKALTEISVENTTLNLNVNDNVDSGATLTPADAGNLTYTSSNETVAVVENGKIKAVGAGEANITVSFAGDDRYFAAENKTIAVTVNLNGASVSVDNDTLDLLVDDEFTIIPTTTPEGLNVTYVLDDSGVVSVDDSGVVSVDDSGVVSVDDSGVVTALKEGNATITVKVGGDGVYAENSTTVTVTVSKVPTEIIIENDTVDMKVNDVVDPVVSLMPSNAGNLSFMVSDADVILVNGSGVITAVGEGTATVTVSFKGNDKYAASNATITVTVTLNDASVSVENDTLELDVYGEYTITPTTTPEGLNVTFTSSDESVVTVDADGKVTAVGGGSATITVSIGGDGVYAENSTEMAVTVNKLETILTIDDVKTVYNTTGAVVATLTDENGNVLPDVKVKIVVGDLTQTAKTDENGQVSLDISSLAPGEYKISARSSGTNPIYNEAKTSAKAIVYEDKLDTTLTIPDVVTVSGVGGAAVATLTDSDGNIISGVNVKIVVDDLSIIAKTDENGQVSLDISSLEPGEYKISARSSGVNSLYKESKTTAKAVVSEEKLNTTLTIPDVVTVSGVGGAVVATLTDSDGNIISDVKVKIVVDDLSIIAKTDENGQVSLDISSLAPGEYKISARSSGVNEIYKEAKTTAKAIISEEKLDATLTIPNVVVVGNSSALVVATLKDSYGNIISGVNVKIAVGGLTKTAKTDENGQVSLDISGLAPGEYKISARSSGVSEIYNEAKTTAKAIISEEKLDTTLTIPDVTVDGSSSGLVVATLKDSYNNLVSGVKVKIVVGDLSKTAKTDENGQVSLDISGLAPGEYKISARSSGTGDLYNEAKATAKAIVNAN